jgi:DNA-binding transcriptional ArsR family regulator
VLSPPQPPLSVPEAADLFRLLGDPRRLRLLLALAGRGEAFVGDLAAAAGLPRPTTSNYLLRLRLAGVVTSRWEGHRAYYRLTSPFVAEVLRGVRGG